MRKIPRLNWKGTPRKLPLKLTIIGSRTLSLFPAWKTNPIRTISSLQIYPITQVRPQPSHTLLAPLELPLTNFPHEDPQGNIESIHRSSVRIPLEVDDDDEEMGEMVAPGSGCGMIDSDDEAEAIINESLGYANFYASKKYGGYRQHGPSMFDDDVEDADSSEDRKSVV